MTALRKSNKQGFTYVVAVAILGLMAFMGIFLMQSSSTEYSQTSLSVYRTMGRQLAEAAADEAAVILEENFKEKKELFNLLIEEASTSGSLRSGGQTGKCPDMLKAIKNLSDLTELNKKNQNMLDCEYLQKYHISRVGFEIESINATIEDLRPIPQGPLDFDSCYYTPKDRYDKGENKAYPFDTGLSKDWYCTLRIDVAVSLQKQRKLTINYSLSKDIKIINVGPMARNYTFYSILGTYISNYSDQATKISAIKNALNGGGGSVERGRLILWNMPFQSRIFHHGPAVVRLENPSWESQNDGAYNSPPNKVGPGPSMAFQYSSTFYGFSYFPDEYRCLFPNARSLSEIWGHVPTLEDENTLQNDYRPSRITHKTASEGGLYPENDTGFLTRFGNLFKSGWKDTYYVGKNVHQLFLPAGPYCRTPWRYTGGTPREKSIFAPNQKDPPPCRFPEEDTNIVIEHRWKPDDSDFEENTKIIAEVSKITYRNALNSISKSEYMMEFSLNYYNNEELDGFFSKLFASVGSIGSKVLNTTTLGWQVIWDGVSTAWNHFFKKDGSQVVDEETEYANLFPTNYKQNYMGVVTRRLKDEKDIPLDENNRWKLNGIYWLDSLNIDNSITYIGTGTLVVCRNSPMTIRGNVICARDSNGNRLGHLNIFYHPYDSTIGSDLANNKAYKRMIKIDSNNGKGILIEASVYSLAGIWCKTGENISLSDSSDDTWGKADPTKQLTEWDSVLQKVMERSNLIKGNYINFHTFLQTKCGQDDNNDLWIMHDYDNPLFFRKNGDGYTMVQEYLDLDDENYKERKNYEYAVHDFFMSPKIQHIGVKGAL